MLLCKEQGLTVSHTVNQCSQPEADKLCSMGQKVVLEFFSLLSCILEPTSFLIQSTLISLSPCIMANMNELVALLRNPYGFKITEIASLLYPF
jgi:hypothetical protein